ncbi:MAG: N-acetylmuramoyl-L-alanine amidase [Aquisalimonadaceae bacterium]
MNRVLWSLILLFIASSAMADQARVESVRVWAEGGETRVVLDLSGPVEHRVFTLTGPDRVVVDISDAVLTDGGSPDAQGVLKQVRSGARGDQDLRMVLDVERAVRTQSFLVEPNGQFGHRLVIDLRDAEQRQQPVRSASSSQRRELVVAIDAGHGGRDPGAIGPGGTREKDIVLDVARKLAYLLDKQPGVRPILIREDDRFVPLAERRERARSERADIFVSIHADAVESGGPRGSSVYTLSQTGATSQAARLLAQRENAADLIGGVSLSDKDELVRSVLVDLSRGATLEASVELASDVLQQMASVGPIHKKDVERAGFVVLQSLDMPSVLVELAFISNSAEERLLRGPDHQWKLARAMANGVSAYAERQMPGSTQIAGGREHVVKRGDTLSGIARQHQVSVSKLRSANDLNGDRIIVGTTLRIP